MAFLAGLAVFSLILTKANGGIVSALLFGAGGYLAVYLAAHLSRIAIKGE